ncbi:MAG: family 43 glycosylhydrolase [Prolixibacteraceae bacterium]
MIKLYLKYLTTIVLFLTLTAQLSAIDLKGVINSHDPATLIKDGDVYWHFTTGDGIWSSVSSNLINWSPSNKPVFPRGTYPAWVKTYVPDFTGSFWAPDVIYMNDAYYIYYSCSQWGTTKSAIGVSKSTSLNDPKWIEKGKVVSSSGSSTAINAIDPGLFRDDDGQIYMVYGSWFGGIGIVDIDSVKGTATSSVTHLYGGNHQSIEAPYLFKEEGYYYLVVNRGTCCDGVNSTYYITVGRSENVKGPYTDFRNLLTKSGKYIGPGHFGLLRESCASYVSIHYYDGNDNGNAKLDILKMTMVDGWPSLTRDFTIEPCQTGSSANVLLADDWSVKLYPNPVSDGILHLEIHEANSDVDEINVEIYSKTGQLLFRKTMGFSQVLDIETDLPTGTYVLNVQFGPTVYSEQFLVE